MGQNLNSPVTELQSDSLKLNRGERDLRGAAGLDLDLLPSIHITINNTPQELQNSKVVQQQKD